MPNEDITHFTAVDQTADPTFFARFLHEANRNPMIIASKSIIIAGLHLQEADHVLDVGCGMGADVFDLAARVGAAGHVTGVDMSASLIEEARRHAEARNFPVSFEVGDVQALRFEDDTFDAVRTERLLMHVPDADRAFTEMVRVLRPRGHMAIFDFDWETQFCDSPHREVTRKIAQSFCDSFKHGWIGRRLPGLFQRHRMTDVSVTYHMVTVPFEFLQLLLGGHVAHAVAAGTLSDEEANEWWTDLAQASRDGTFLYGFTAFIVSGRKQ
ncbi:MAG: methyltransferase domain-containing protein [Gammaproteobacteria bacterium]